MTPNRTTTYEVFGYAQGKWRPLAFCDTREEAMAEALKLHRKRHYLGIRVTAEHYDPVSRLFHSQVVYRHSAVEAKAPQPNGLQFAGAGHGRRAGPSMAALLLIDQIMARFAVGVAMLLGVMVAVLVMLYRG